MGGPSHMSGGIHHGGRFYGGRRYGGFGPGFVGGLALVLKTVDGIVHPAFFGAFTVAVIVFSMAFFVNEREPGKLGDG